MPASSWASDSSNFYMCWGGLVAWSLVEGGFPFPGSALLPYLWIHISTWNGEKVAHHSVILRCSYSLSSIPWIFQLSPSFLSANVL